MIKGGRLCLHYSVTLQIMVCESIAAAIVPFILVVTGHILRKKIDTQPLEQRASIVHFFLSHLANPAHHVWTAFCSGGSCGESDDGRQGSDFEMEKLHCGSDLES